MMQRNIFSVRPLGVIFCQRILHAQLSTFLQKKNRCRRELFGNGADAKDRIRHIGSFGFHIRHPERAAEQHFLLARHQHSEAWMSFLFQLACHEYIRARFRSGCGGVCNAK